MSCLQMKEIRVHSGRSDSEKRDVVRKTWNKEKEYPSNGIRVDSYSITLLGPVGERNLGTSPFF